MENEPMKFVVYALDDPDYFAVPREEYIKLRAYLADMQRWVQAARDLLRLPEPPLVRRVDGKVYTWLEAGEWSLSPDDGDTPASLRESAAAFLAAADWLERNGW